MHTSEREEQEERDRQAAEELRLMRFDGMSFSEQKRRLREATAIHQRRLGLPVTTR